VSPWWKISGHGMMMGGTIVALTTSWGPVGLLFVPVALAVCWSRVRLQDHTRPQVISGFIYGLLFLGSIYAWIVM
jgi:membrane-associated phospholipid phosphatase